MADTKIAAHQGKAGFLALKQCLFSRTDSSPEFGPASQDGHDSWTRTYANPAFFEWLLAHSGTAHAPPPPPAGGVCLAVSETVNLRTPPLYPY